MKLKRITETYGLKVYTEDGVYFGEVEEPLLSENRVYGWKIKVGNAELLKQGIKGVIIQHQLVKAIGDIMIISRAAMSVKKEEEKKEETKS